MGGEGSGRRAGDHKRVDDIPGLDAQQLIDGARRGGGRCRVALTIDGCRIDAVGCEVYLYTEVVEISVGTTFEIIDLVSVAMPRRGGRRWYWRCPRCGRARSVLYLARDDGHLCSCRLCLGLRYRSQHVSPHRRLSTRVGVLRRLLGIGETVLDPIPDEVLASGDEETQQLVSELIEVERAILARVKARRRSIDRLRQRHGVGAGE